LEIASKARSYRDWRRLCCDNRLGMIFFASAFMVLRRVAAQGPVLPGPKHPLYSGKFC
jgi:hypothetical protein